MEIQDLAFHDVAQPGMRGLHEEWQGRRPHSARQPRSRAPLNITCTTVPFSGATSGGKVALPRKKNDKRWVERPVATGKMSLTHMGGQRYEFNTEPRNLEWQEYVRTINPMRS